MQNLVVYPGKKGRYFVAAGERRRRAIMQLIEEGRVPNDFVVNCRVCESDDAVELSLTENDQREAMHPVDQFEAFSALIAAGKTTPDIAARFGITEIIVRRRLALAKVSPLLLDLYRNEEMTFEQLSAFTVCDDRERQEQVWNSLSTWNRNASQIKGALSTTEVPATDKRLKLIGGLDAYELAGGSVRRDLFDRERNEEPTASVID